jgi:hypothetical protein
MFEKGDLVETTINNPLYLLLDCEVGTVQSFYFKDSVQYVTVLFPEYGSEQGYTDSSLYEKVETLVEESAQDEADRYEIMEATHFIQTQKIYAQFILDQ